MSTVKSMSADEFLARNELREMAANGGTGANTRLRVHNTARTGRTRLQLPERLSLDVWRHIGVQLSTIYDATAWWLGDWLVYGEEKYPDRYLWAVSETTLNYQTLRNYAWVARRFSPSRRRDGLSFGHHAEVASLDPAEQDRWLDRAEKEGWSRNRLRNHLKAERDVGKNRIADGVLRVRASVEQRKQWETAAERSHATLSDWAADALTRAAQLG